MPPHYQQSLQPVEVGDYLEEEEEDEEYAFELTHLNGRPVASISYKASWPLCYMAYGHN